MQLTASNTDISKSKLWTTHSFCTLMNKLIQIVADERHRSNLSKSTDSSGTSNIYILLEYNSNIDILYIVNHNKLL